MSDYRDPKVTTPHAGNMRRWIWIGAGVIVALILLSLLFGGEEEAVPVVTEEPAATAPAAPAEAPAEEPAEPAAPAN